MAGCCPLGERPAIRNDVSSCQLSVRCVSSIAGAGSAWVPPRGRFCAEHDVSALMSSTGHHLGLSSRMFLVAPDDPLWRLSTRKFDRMLRNPASNRLPAFAGQRARMASVVVELVASEPMRVIRTTYSVLAFDAEGRIDPGRFEEQQFALAESAVAPVIASSADGSDQPVVDATTRFIAQGGGGGLRRPSWRARLMRPHWSNDRADGCKPLRGSGSAAPVRRLKALRSGRRHQAGTAILPCSSAFSPDRSTRPLCRRQLRVAGVHPATRPIRCARAPCCR